MDERTKAAIISDLEETTWTQQRIAESHGVSRKDVGKICRTHVPDWAPSGKLSVMERRAIAEELRLTLDSAKEIAERYGTSRYKVRSIQKIYSVTREALDQAARWRERSIAWDLLIDGGTRHEVARRHRAGIRTVERIEREYRRHHGRSIGIEKEREVVRELLETTLPMREIARRNSIDQRTVRRISDSNGIVRKGMRTPEQTKNAIIRDLVETDDRQYEIARRHGVTKETVGTIKRKESITRPKRKEEEAAPEIERELRETSDSIRKIAERNGVATNVVLRVKGQQGITRRPERQHSPSQKTLAILRDLRETDRTLAEIARDHGLSRQRIQQIEKKWEVVRPKRSLKSEVSPETEQAILRELRETRDRQTLIASRHGTNPLTVAAIRREHGAARPARPPSSRVRAVIDDLLNTSDTQKVIGERHGTGQTDVSAILIRYGIERRRASRISAEAEAGIVRDLLETEHSNAEIAARNGATANTVARIGRREGGLRSPSGRSRSKNLISPEKEAAVVRELLENRCTQEEIAGRHGIARITVNKIKRRNPETKDLRRKPGRRTGAEGIHIKGAESGKGEAIIRDLQETGDTQEEIARRHGVSRETVSRVKRESNARQSGQRGRRKRRADGETRAAVIRELRETTDTQRAIAERHGLDEIAVGRIKRENSIVRPGGGPDKGRKLTPETKEAILNDLAEGRGTHRQIALRHGVGTTTLYRAIRKIREEGGTDRTRAGSGHPKITRPYWEIVEDAMTSTDGDRATAARNGVSATTLRRLRRWARAIYGSAETHGRVSHERAMRVAEDLRETRDSQAAIAGRHGVSAADVSAIMGLLEIERHQLTQA